eukprot:g2663.t1
MKNFPHMESYSDWRRMYASEVIDQSRGYFQNFAVDPAKPTRCFLGVVGLFYYLARFKLLVVKDIEAAFQIFRPLESLLRKIGGEEINKYNNLSPTAADIYELHPQPQEEDEYHWPFTSQMLTAFELDFVAELSKQNTILDEGSGAPIPIGNAFNVWPSDAVGVKNSGAQFSGNTTSSVAVDANGALAGGEAEDAPRSWTLTGVEGSNLLGNSFKVFVYDPRDVVELQPLMRTGSSYCRQLDSGAEVDLHHWFLSCPNCRTSDPNEADFFFVPQYSACLAYEKLRTGSSTPEQVTAEIGAFFDRLVPKLPHFKRSGGRDHIFALTATVSTFGGATAAAMEFLKKTATTSKMAEALLLFSEGGAHFHFAKDVMLPARENLQVLVQQFALSVAPHSAPISGAVLRLDQAESARSIRAEASGWESRPKTGASLIGRVSTKLKDETEKEYGQSGMLQWMDRWEAAGKVAEGKEFFGDMIVPRERNEAATAGETPDELLLHSRDSKFCYLAAPPMDATRSLFAGCIPVFIKDDYELPLQQVLALLKTTDKWSPNKGKRCSPIWTQCGAGLVGRCEGEANKKVIIFSRRLYKYICLRRYVYPPSVLSTDFMPARLSKMCPELRTENALMAVHAILAAKKRTLPKYSQGVFPLANPKSGSVNLVDGDFNLVQRFSAPGSKKK